MRLCAFAEQYLSRIIIAKRDRLVPTILSKDVTYKSSFRRFYLVTFNFNKIEKWIIGSSSQSHMLFSRYHVAFLFLSLAVVFPIAWYEILTETANARCLVFCTWHEDIGKETRRSKEPHSRTRVSKQSLGLTTWSGWQIYIQIWK